MLLPSYEREMVLWCKPDVTKSALKFVNRKNMLVVLECGCELSVWKFSDAQKVIYQIQTSHCFWLPSPGTRGQNFETHGFAEIVPNISKIYYSSIQLVKVPHRSSELFESHNQKPRFDP